jgi:hydrogenase maturation factor HypF (carbamoyltransferase family)
VGTAPAAPDGTPIVIALVHCEQCEREYFSAAVPRMSTPLPACSDCGGSQRIADLIVSE